MESHLRKKDRLASWAWLLTQASYPLFKKAFRPFAQVSFGEADPSGRLNIAVTLLQQEYCTSPPNKTAQYIRRWHEGQGSYTVVILPCKSKKKRQKRHEWSRKMQHFSGPS